LLVAAVALPSELNKVQDKQIEEFSFIPKLNLTYKEQNAMHRKAFVVLQVLDIYSTYRALKYDCAIEMNPILGDVPSVSEMVLLKSIANGYVVLQEDVSNEAFMLMNTASTLVLVNNYKVWDKARQACGKR
jgi:hypothetical protein